jgi:hypothetical protein
MASNKLVDAVVVCGYPQQRAYYQMPDYASWLKCRNYQNFTCLSSTLQKDLIPGMPISLGLFPFRQGTGIRTKWVCTVVWCLSPLQIRHWNKELSVQQPLQMMRHWGDCKMRHWGDCKSTDSLLLHISIRHIIIPSLILKPSEDQNFFCNFMRMKISIFPKQKV